MDTLSDIILFQKYLLLKFWCFTALPKSPSKKGLNPKLNRQVYYTNYFTQGFPMWQSYNSLKITRKEPGQDRCYSSHPQLPLNPLLLMKDSNYLHIYNFFKKPLTLIPTHYNLHWTNAGLYHSPPSWANGHKVPDPFLSRFSSEKPHTHGSWQSLNSLEISVACKSPVLRTSHREDRCMQWQLIFMRVCTFICMC